ncbi:MAG: phasin family protein, partial [candidate division Zixibacteria bacterium]|nr:phasin family protein [candidate division Zixibacteria bacterium]
EDVTLAVLGRIVMTEVPSWGNVRQSKEFLRQVISIGGVKSMSILRNTILASFGAFQVTRSKAEKIIDDLIKKGELDKSDRKKAVLELLERAEKSSSTWRDKIAKEAGKAQKEISSTLKKLDLAKKTDMKKVEAKVDKLAKTIRQLEKKLEDDKT